MEDQELIAVELFCSNYQVDFSFIEDLNHSGLLEVKSIEEKAFLDQAELHKLEQLVRMRYEFNINIEGIEAISHLLDRLKSLQAEITALKNRLRLYES